MEPKNMSRYLSYNIKMSSISNIILNLNNKFTLTSKTSFIKVIFSVKNKSWKKQNMYTQNYNLKR